MDNNRYWQFWFCIQCCFGVLRYAHSHVMHIWMCKSCMPARVEACPRFETSICTLPEERVYVKHRVCCFQEGPLGRHRTGQQASLKHIYLADPTIPIKSPILIASTVQSFWMKGNVFEILFADCGGNRKTLPWTSFVHLAICAGMLQKMQWKHEKSASKRAKKHVLASFEKGPIFYNPKRTTTSQI